MKRLILLSFLVSLSLCGACQRRVLITPIEVISSESFLAVMRQDTMLITLDGLSVPKRMKHKAKKYLEDNLNGQVKVYHISTDGKFDVFTGRKNIGRSMVKQGYALYIGHSIFGIKGNSMIRAEGYARDNRKGLWRDYTPMNTTQ